MLIVGIRRIIVRIYRTCPHSESVSSPLSEEQGEGGFFLARRKIMAREELSYDYGVIKGRPEWITISFRKLSSEDPCLMSSASNTYRRLQNVCHREAKSWFRLLTDCGQSYYREQ